MLADKRSDAFAHFFKFNVIIGIVFPFIKFQFQIAGIGFDMEGHLAIQGNIRVQLGIYKGYIMITGYTIVHVFLYAVRFGLIIRGVQLVIMVRICNGYPGFIRWEFMA